MKVYHFRPMAWAQFAILVFILSLLLFMILLVVFSTAGNTDRFMNFPQGAQVSVGAERSG